MSSRAGPDRSHFKFQLPEAKGTFNADTATSLPPDSLRSKPSLKSQETVREKPDYNREVWHFKFRSFCPSKKSSPIQCLKQISELCHQWLRPDLHSKEEILDLVILEQFMISMPPELQALVKENQVKSCKELERMLRDHRKPRQWSIVNWEGRLYLRRDPTVKEAAAVEDEWDHVALSQEHLSSQSEEPPNRGQASPELQNPSETEEPSTSQREEALLEKVPESNDPDWQRPEQSPESDSVRAWEKASVFVPQDPQPAQGPDVMMPQEDAKLDAVPAFTHILEKRGAAASIDLQSPCSPSGDDAPASPGGGSRVDDAGDRQLAVVAARQPVERVDRRPGQPRFECGDCKRTFLYRSQFIIHQRSHTGERPFECHLCNKGFLQSSDLRVHQRTHTGEKPYVCGVCSKVFAHESTLLGHTRVHTKEKPYRCEHCGKRFSHKGNLNVHLRIHSGSRPYSCEECDAAFRQQATLRRHVKTHARGEPV
ncbi:zinc finger and SCAN domain-containing protein 5B [Mesocricetus auratus]|uniref:Zinc finger and SCAN domain-containing protein 5B n=1 Tax=Mesocricetus auratus TaxID=10036 RepID=A0A3Q0DHH3_MESAU|nr:zinc finger and SCAN domain-containing protein 5B [Mesocricetus auratus]